MFRASLTWLLLTGAASAQLMSPTAEEAWRRSFPKTDSPELKEVFESPDTLWYTSRELLGYYEATRFPTYFINGPEGIVGASPITRNPSADPSPPPFHHGQPNREFPWKPTLGGGSHKNGNLQTVKGLLLPPNPHNNNRTLAPIAVFGRSPTRWVYPNGTRIVELAYLIEPSTRKWYPIEARMRIREPDDWGTRLFRHFGTREELAAIVGETHPVLSERILAPDPGRMRVRSPHPRPSVNTTAYMEMLPDFPPDLTKRVLRRPLIDVTGVSWADNSDGPRARQTFHVALRLSSTAAHGTGERETCRQCHRDIGRHARAFDVNRGWYGRVRGSDGIFSIHPFGPQGAKLVRAGYFKRFSRNDFVSYRDLYTQSKFLAEELRRDVD